MAAEFGCLPDELVATVLAHVGPIWRPLARMVCRRWAAIVGAPSRTEALGLGRSRPAGARPEAWIGGRVLCASAIAHALDTNDTGQNGSDGHGILSAPSTAASWCLRWFPTAPPCDIAHALLASGRADAAACALALVGNNTSARSKAIATGVYAAVRKDRADTLHILLGQQEAPPLTGTEDAPDMADAVSCAQWPWIGELWTWTARYDAGRITAYLLDIQSACDPLWDPLREAWAKGDWPKAAGSAGADRVVAIHMDHGVFSPSLANKVGVAAAAAGHVRTCALVVDSLRNLAAKQWTGTTSTVDRLQGQEDLDTHAVDIDQPFIEQMIAQMAMAAVCGHAPDRVLDWLEDVVGYQPDCVALLSKAVKWGPSCGRGALALIVRWPGTARVSLDLVACAIGRAVLSGYLDDADRAVARLHAFGIAVPPCHGAIGNILWYEVVLDVTVIGLTRRTALDTLALLCALAARCGFGDRDALAAALAGDHGGDTRCRPQWAHFAAESAEMWAPWCRVRPIAGAFVRGLLRRVESRHAHTAKTLMAWLDAAGLVLDHTP
ncbi:F-box incomplete domain containing protein [Pandoravirus quercus]|uniref:F-box incomplete domain containing protein n=2 Tax=Pandoravirus TaxID=2060084 RepID=A0A2U7U7V7_9VIRU|nr:F-box incomplete domain containing protein [Pandoravirus quercus]AVK74518.1 F-box incomplete domain containing protein [Pandoravirus quercus]QBZ80700.1 F-box incomplete domain containing protein [Pandoravirus celtis]